MSQRNPHKYRCKRGGVREKREERLQNEEVERRDRVWRERNEKRKEPMIDAEK